MQIVINIHEETYIHLRNGGNIGASLMIENAIKNGTPLPKGHGRLIDADKFLKDNEAYTGWILDSSDWGGKNAYKDTLEDLVSEAETIIKADRGEK